MRRSRRRYLLRRPGRRSVRRLLPTAGLVLVVGGLVAAGVFIVLDRTSLDDGGIQTGRGELPSSIPAGFPIPPGAVIGETSVDRDSATTSVELVTAGSRDEAVSTYTVGLVSGGYVVERSEPEGDEWVIRFSRGDLRGTLVLDDSGAGVRALLTIVDP